MNITVLGAGRVGEAMARDLAAEEDFTVTAVDIDLKNLGRFTPESRVATRREDLGTPAGVTRAVEGADLVVGAVPGFMGFATARAVIEAGKDLVDISFFAEDPFALDALARERGVVAVVDCGVAPGLSNLLLGRATATWQEVERFVCYVGGLPARRSWPYEYKAPFSPVDVIEEYTRPARLVENGRTVTRPALSELERVELPGVGTLEAFNTDGLRTLIETEKVPWMKEKTLRYPGHTDRMLMLRETGFFSSEPIRVGEGQVRPVDLTSRLLFDAWHLGEDEEDLTVMRVEIEGVWAGEDGRGLRARHTSDLLDRRDPVTGASSMARTTGYTATGAARLVARGLYRRPGISPPELIGREARCCEALMAHLAARGIRFTGRVEPIA